MIIKLDEEIEFLRCRVAYYRGRIRVIQAVSRHYKSDFKISTPRKDNSKLILSTLKDGAKLTIAKIRKATGINPGSIHYYLKKGEGTLWKRNENFTWQLINEGIELDD